VEEGGLSEGERLGTRRGAKAERPLIFPQKVFLISIQFNYVHFIYSLTWSELVKLQKEHVLSMWLVVVCVLLYLKTIRYG
jgi:hypothetical protein